MIDLNFDVGMILLIALYSVLMLCIGYALAEREALHCIVNVSHWIESTESNDWVHLQMYNELKDEHKKLLEEYNQYRGTMQAINDYREAKND